MSRSTEDPAMEGHPVPYATRPEAANIYSLLSLPSLKEFMVHRLVEEGTYVSTMEAWQDYADHRSTTEEFVAGASEITMTFLTDKLFWRVHWPLEPFPKDDILFTPYEKDILLRASERLHLCTAQDRAYEAHCRQMKTVREYYVMEGQSWSRGIAQKIERMVKQRQLVAKQREKVTDRRERVIKWREQVVKHKTEDEEGKLDLEALAELKI